MGSTIVRATCVIVAALLWDLDVSVLFVYLIAFHDVIQAVCSLIDNYNSSDMALIQNLMPIKKKNCSCLVYLIGQPNEYY